MTFSIVGHCPDTGMFGVAISSSSPAVAARCSFARAGVGAVATQNVTDPRLGPHALDLMARGASPREALAILERSGSHMAFRQVLAVGRSGESAIYSGTEVLGMWSEAQGRDTAAAGNLLADAGVPEVMVQHFSNTEGHLGERLVGALRAGLDAIRMLQGFTWDTQQSAWLINHQKIRIRVENGQKRLSRRIVDKRSWGGLVHARLIAGFAKNKRRGKCRAFQNPNQMEPIKVL